MYLYLGQDTVIRTQEVVGIFDLDNTTISKITKEFLASSQQQNQVIEVTQELPKSFVLCKKDGKNYIYLSQISPSTLKKRANSKKGFQG